ncbi:hypothetical protein STANM309S_05349 [Streptomyces tanashiensis]
MNPDDQDVQYVCNLCQLQKSFIKQNMIWKTRCMKMRTLLSRGSRTDIQIVYCFL